MLRMWRSSLALIVVAAALTQAHAQVTTVVTVQSIDQLMADAQYLLTIAGQEERAKQIEGLIGALTQGKRFQGMDTKRPLGVYVGMPKKDDITPPFALFIPVTKQDEFLDLLKQVGAEPGKPEKDIYPVEILAVGTTVHMRFANQCAYVSDSADKLEGKLPDPATFIPAVNKKNLLAATVQLDQIPKEQKDQLLEQLDAQLDKEKEKKEGESDQDHQTRLLVLNAMRGGIGAALEDGKELTLAFSVDQKANNLALDLSLTAKPGTKTAKRIKDFGPAGATAPVHFELSVGKLAMLLLPDSDDEKIQKVRKLFSENSQGNDKVRLTLAGGEALNLRLDISGQIVKLGATLAPQDGAN